MSARIDATIVMRLDSVLLWSCRGERRKRTNASSGRLESGDEPSLERAAPIKDVSIFKRKENRENSWAGLPG